MNNITDGLTKSYNRPPSALKRDIEELCTFIRIQAKTLYKLHKAFENLSKHLKEKLLYEADPNHYKPIWK